MVAVAMLTAITSLLPSYSVWLTLSVLAISSLIYWFGLSSYGLISHVSLPGPKPWPYVGNLIETVRYGGLHKALLEYSKKYGRVYKMYLGRDPIITVADPEILKHILVKDFDKFRNRPEFISGNPPLNKGLFGARDDNWKRVRSIVTPTFSSHKLKEIVPLIQEAVDALMEKFENFAKNEESVDLSTPFGRLTLDIILSAGFGLKAQIQTSPDTELLEKSLSIFSVPVYIRALTMFPFNRQIKRYFNLNPILHVPYFTNLAKEVLQIRRNSSIGRRDLVQVMLEAHDENVNEVNTLTDEEIIGQCIVFLAAGSETTGASLAFIAFYLAHNPEVQKKLLKEIDLAVQCRDDVPTFEFVQNIGYLDRVVCEVLRLCTVGYVNVRQCMETCVIKGIEFPAGVTVNIPSFVIHRDPEFWAKPEEFDPDRFLAEETEKRPAFSYLPFGLGPKQCIATRMALLEIKMALVTILQKFRFERGVGTTEKLEFRAGTILQPREPIKAKIVFRSSSDKQ